MKYIMVFDAENVVLGKAVAIINDGEKMHSVDGEIRPLPQKIYAEFPNSYEYGLADGYNRCVDEVMGETE